MNPVHRVCAIDVGTRNFAWCVVDKQNFLVPVHWALEDLWKSTKKPTNTDAVRFTLEWLERNRGLLENCDEIILERQMRDIFIVINTVIHCHYFPKVRIRAPQSIGAFWKLPRKREPKKAAGIAIVRAVGCKLPAGKVDDLCDAWLMATMVLLERGDVTIKVKSDC